MGSAAPSWAFEEAADLPNFQTIATDLYRGGRPTDPGMQALAAKGVHTILNLENDDGAVAHEGTVAQSLGIRYLSVPLSAIWYPSKSSVNEAVADLDTPSYYPLYVHCEYGEDRTGLIVGLFRVFDEKWTPVQAYQEMRQLGFHPELLGLEWYFDHATGY